MHVHHPFDIYTYNNALKRVPPHFKVLVSLVALLIVVASPSFVAPIAIFGLMYFLTVVKAKIPNKVYLKALTAPLLFTIPTLPLMAFFFGGGDVLFTVNILGFSLAATRDGFNLALLVASRVIAGSASLFFLAFTTPMTEIFGVMRALKFPSLFVEIAMMIYRYIFVLIEEAEQMIFAQNVRLGYNTYKRSYESFGLLVSNLFIRSWQKGERIFRALEARGYEGQFVFSDQSQQKITFLPLSILGAIGIGLVLLAYYTRGLTIF
jgi:cobalt/nickel transport system permease protein